jgi:hypothetical protein
VGAWVSAHDAHAVGEREYLITYIHTYTHKHTHAHTYRWVLGFQRMMRMLWESEKGGHGSRGNVILNDIEGPTPP